MKKIFTITHILDLLALSTFGLLLLDAVFYSGFSQKHFFVKPTYFMFFSFFVVSTFYFFKKYSVSLILNKLNNIFFYFSVFLSLFFLFLEEFNYVNFTYTHFHINPTNFLLIPIFSDLILYLYNFKIFTKHFYFFIPLLALFFSQYFSFLYKFEIIILYIFKTVFVNYFLWLTVLLFCTSLFKKKSHSIILFLSFFATFTAANHFKIKLLNNYFIISDLVLVKHNFGYLLELFLQIGLLNLSLILLALILLIYFFVYLNKKINTNNPNRLVRFVLFVTFGYILIFPVFFPTQYQNFIKKIKIDTYVWGPIQNCKYNGILFCFYDDLKNFTNPAPSDYSQQTINQIYADSNSLLSSGEVLKPVEQGWLEPNIIVILSEALWDVTKLPNIKFSSDPISNIRKDIKSTLISPTIGTATANVEFELLTGLSNYYLKGKTPYSQSVKKDLPTLFTAFRETGYQTTTIHTFHASMYNRPKVYKHFGLEKFISIEDMSDYETIGPFVSDASLNQKILKQYNSTTQPQFIFALSMQNHFPFGIDTFGKHQIKVNSKLPTYNHNVIQTYTDGIHLTDLAYKALKGEISKSGKPTIIIFFGDHLPLFDQNLNFYQEASFDISDQTKMHSTPIAMWSNYPVKLQPKSYLSPSFLGLEILDLAKIKPKNQFSYLKSISLTDTVLHSNLKPKFTPQQLRDYELIQYDLIYGKQYSLK